MHVPCVETAKNSKTATEYRRKLCCSILNVDPISFDAKTAPGGAPVILSALFYVTQSLYGHCYTCRGGGVVPQRNLL